MTHFSKPGLLPVRGQSECSVCWDIRSTQQQLFVNFSQFVREEDYKDTIGTAIRALLRQGAILAKRLEMEAKTSVCFGG